MKYRLKLFLIGTVTILFVGNTFCKQAAARGMRVQRNVIYLQQKQGAIQERNLDIYAPAEGENYPVVIWVHGGGWKFGNKADVHLKPTAFTQAGYVLVSINYRLHPRTDIPGQASDIAAAVKWVKTNISKYAGDKNQIVLMGHSAGAHLSALIATDEHYLKDQQLGFTDIKGVILLDGACYDVAEHIQDIPEQLFKSLFVSVFTSDVKLQQAASPTAQIHSTDTLPAFLIIYVGERKDSSRQSQSLAASIRRAGGSARLHAARGENHATLNLTLGMPTKPATKWVFDFLDETTN